MHTRIQRYDGSCWNAHRNWKCSDDESYSVSATSAPPGGTRFDSGTLSRNSRFVFVPHVAETWEYRDQFSGVNARLMAK
jgi:hypothetical protein